MALYPLLLEPALHVKVWGGRRLETVMRKRLPTDEPYGESWEMHDTARVANGPLAGRKLAELLPEHGEELLGPDNDPAQGFPLLAKLIDASEWLSIQVHPDDEQAHELEGEPRGKTEAWYILAADPGAQLVIGLRPHTTRDTMAQAIQNNTLESLLIYAEIAPGDVLFIPAGTIHAIGAGVLLYEIQQSSDTTYRLYDWGRMGLDGKPRELHVDKGVAVANLATLPKVERKGDDGSLLVELILSRYFTTLLHQLNDANGKRAVFDTLQTHFHILTCIAGEATIIAGESIETLPLGQTALIPASLGAYTLAGEARVLRSFQTGLTPRQA